MKEALEYLDGKKTYLACAVGFALLFGKWQGWWVIPEDFYKLLMLSALCFLRRGIAKKALHCFMVGSMGLVLCGCVSVPDTWNYTVSIDHQTGETTSYVGVSGPLKWKPERTR